MSELKPHSTSAEFSGDLHEVVRELFGNYKFTDMQFNIGRVEGSMPRGLDIVDPVTGDRLYCTGGSSDPAEAKLRRANADLLPSKVTEIEGIPSEDLDTLVVYGVPDGTRMLLKTMRQNPYKDRYMHDLSERAGRFMRKVAQLEPGLFGITPDAIAISPNDGAVDRSDPNDDTRLFIVPPVKQPLPNQPAVNLYEFGRALMPEEYVDSYVDGLEGR